MSEYCNMCGHVVVRVSGNLTGAFTCRRSLAGAQITRLINADCLQLVSLNIKFTRNCELLPDSILICWKLRNIFSEYSGRVNFSVPPVISHFERQLTLILLTWSIGWARNNASKWQTGFNFAFKGLL